jgi:hypothetical protein
MKRLSPCYATIAVAALAIAVIAAPARLSATACVASPTTLCISDQPGDNRFQLQMSWATSQNGGESGTANAIPLSTLGVAEGGLFWFSSANNPEMLVKVLNGCSVNSEHWVFASAGTNVGFTLTVTDTSNGLVKTYPNADRHAAAPIQDTGAFSCSSCTPPNATITAAPNVCSGSTGNVAAVPSAPGASYSWGITNGSITAGAGTSQITYSAGVSGTVSLTVSVTANNCIATGETAVTIGNITPPSEITFDCTPGAPGCDQISIAGDPVNTSAPSGFYGNLDPSLRWDPNGGNRLYMTYSFPRVITGTATPVIEIHLAASDDGGSTWNFLTNLWPSVQQADGNYTSHEVSNLAAQDLSGVTTWYGTSHYYEVTPGGPLYGSVSTPSSYYVLSSSSDPTRLGSAPDDTIHLNGGGTTSAYSSPSYPNLSTLAGDPSCTVWREPAIMVQGDVLYFVAQCSVASGAFSYYGVFAARTEGKMSTWSWKYLGKLFESQDAAQVLPSAKSPLFTELDLTQKPDGSIIAIMSAMDQSTQQKYGSRTADVATLGNYDAGFPPQMARDCSGKLLVTGQFTASDLNTLPNLGPGASCYEAAAPNLGLLIVRRDMKPNVHGFVFRTNKAPD